MPSQRVLSVTKPEFCFRLHLVVQYVARKEEMEQRDAMKKPENRTKESRNDFAFPDVLSQTQDFNSEIEAADPDEVPGMVGERHKKKEDMALNDAENEQVKQAFARAAKGYALALPHIKKMCTLYPKCLMT